jgi:hypothetical protein
VGGVASPWGCGTQKPAARWLGLSHSPKLQVRKNAAKQEARTFRIPRNVRRSALLHVRQRAKAHMAHCTIHTSEYNDAEVVGRDSLRPTRSPLYPCLAVRVPKNTANRQEENCRLSHTASTLGCKQIFGQQKLSSGFLQQNPREYWKSRNCSKWPVVP